MTLRNEISTGEEGKRVNSSLIVQAVRVHEVAKALEPSSSVWPVRNRILITDPVCEDRLGQVARGLRGIQGGTGTSVGVSVDAGGLYLGEGEVLCMRGGSCGARSKTVYAGAARAVVLGSGSFRDSKPAAVLLAAEKGKVDERQGWELGRRHGCRMRESDRVPRGAGERN